MSACNSSFSLPAIVGCTIGGVLAAEGILALFTYLILRKRRRPRTAKPADAVAFAMVPPVLREREMVKSPVGSLMTRWLNREGITRYSPVELGGRTLVEEEVPLQTHAYPSRSVVEPRRHRPKSPWPSPRRKPVMLPPQPPPPPAPPANLAFYAPELAAVLAEPSIAPTLCDPPPLIPPLPVPAPSSHGHNQHLRPVLAPLRIPNSSAPPPPAGAAPATKPPRLLPPIVAPQPVSPPFLTRLDPPYHPPGAAGRTQRRLAVV